MEPQIEGYAFPGYKLTGTLTLEPDLDENGDLLNPNLVLTEGSLCTVCEAILDEAETWKEKQTSPEPHYWDFSKMTPEASQLYGGEA